MEKRDHNTLIAFLRGESGVIAVLSTFLIGLFALIAALVIDMGYGFVNRNHLQYTADASALAGASILNENDATVRAEANTFAELNMPSARYGDVLVDADIDIGNWDNTARVFTDGGTPRNAVRTTTRRTAAGGNAVETFFAQFAGIGSLDVNTSAIAVNGAGNDTLSCIQALNEWESESFHIFGTANITALGCDIQVDACGENDNFRANGNPDVTIVDTTSTGGQAGYLNVCGGLRENGPVNLPPEEYMDYDCDDSPPSGNLDNCRDGDPFESLDIPTDAQRNASCDETNYSASAGTTMYPGVYCGGVKLTGNGTVDFAPGIYYVKDGSFEVAGNVEVQNQPGTEDDGVTFVMMGADANVDFKGTAAIGLSATNTGSDYDGFLFVGDRENPATSPHVFRGTPDNGISGIVYLPEADMEMKGTADAGLLSGTSDCAVFIADTLYFNGTVDLTVDSTCSNFAAANAFNAGTLVLRLVD